MNKLTSADRVRIVAALVEGNSIRSTVRMTGFAKGTILKLLADMGRVCAGFHNDTVHGIYATRVQADEIWCFVGAKEKNVPDERREVERLGSVWTWKAIDSDSKLLVSYHVGGRNSDDAYTFMQDLASRLAARVQLTTDGHGVYPDAVWEAFGVDVDYAQLVKRYGAPRESEARYSPAVCLGTIRMPRIGKPVKKDISTSHVERANLTLRMGQRRFTRLTNAFSKKFDNLYHAVSLYAVHYNFCRKHQSLGGKTPAMASGLAGHAWSIQELVGLLEAAEQAAIEGGALKRGTYRPRRNCA